MPKKEEKYAVLRCPFGCCEQDGKVIKGFLNLHSLTLHLVQYHKYTQKGTETLCKQANLAKTGRFGAV